MCFTLNNMFIVSDEVLERLVCSECKKYLSQKPIKVYHSRNIKCGRCSDPSDGGVISLFGILAEEALFRCVNRFDGCNQLLAYSDVAEHEKTCVAKQYECPACTSPFKGSTYDIFNHFKQQHEDACLMNSPEFTVSIENEQYKYYLHRKNELLFFITVFYNRSEQELSINICHLGSKQNSSRIYQKFTLYSFDRKIRYKSWSKSCCPVSGGNLNMFKVTISADDFPNDVVICRFTLDTEEVESMVVLPNDFKKSKPISSKALSCMPLEKCSSPPASEIRKYPVEIYRPNVINAQDSTAFIKVEDVTIDLTEEPDWFVSLEEEKEKEEEESEAEKKKKITEASKKGSDVDSASDVNDRESEKEYSHKNGSESGADEGYAFIKVEEVTVKEEPAWFVSLEEEEEEESEGDKKNKRTFTGKKPAAKKAKKGSESEKDSESDSDEDWGKKIVPRRRQAKHRVKRGGGYSKPLQLSPELAALMGADSMARHEVVQKVWSIIKNKNLYDPQNKRYAICDDALLKVIGTKRFRAFGMMKYLKNHFI